jgi:glycosyltransferase involved in cell wall biosynthesis
MINLEVIGESKNRVFNLRLAIENLGVNTTLHSLPSSYKTGKIKFLKRHQLRQALTKQIESTIHEKSADNTVFFASQMPTVYPPILKTLSDRFATIMDIRDIWQEHTYHPYLKRKIERWEQISTMNKVSAVTFTHRGFYNYLVKEINDPNNLYFLSLGANRDIFYYNGKQEPLSNKSINLLWSGRIYEFHYVPFWIEVMKGLQERKADIHLTIVGYGDKEKLVQQKINEYQLKNVSFFNKKFSQEQLAQYLRRADYALASVYPKFKFLYNIAITTKVFEALSCGTPLITSLGREMDDFNSLHGLSDVNKNFNLLYSKPTVNEICNELICLPIVDSTTRKCIFNIAEVFSYQKIASLFKQILQNVLERY